MNRAEVTYQYDSKNEDGSLTAEGDLFSYICSATGRAYDLTEYVNDTNRQYTEVLSAYTVNSGATESYSYNGSQRLSRNNIWNEARGVDHNETSYYLYDGRGSVTANTWQNGMVTNVYQYDPYGQVTLGSTEHTDFYGYNAESYNPNTGLEYLRARYYNADKGRFIQEDTYLGDTTDTLTLNRYAYVKNSPLNYIDPSGFYSASQGADAHNRLFEYLKSKHKNNLFTNVQVSGYEYSDTGTGYIDILYRSNTGDEIYELKTINEPFYRWWTRKIGRPTGPEQRQGYINTFEGNPNYNINPDGISLYPEITGLELKSNTEPNKTIVYVVDPVNPGMIYWYHKGDKKPEKLAMKLKNAKKNGENADCDIIEIGEKAGDIVALVLAGYTIKEIIAIIAEELVIAKSTVQNVFYNFTPFFLPRQFIEMKEKELRGEPIQS